MLLLPRFCEHPAALHGDKIILFAFRRSHLSFGIGRLHRLLRVCRGNPAVDDYRKARIWHDGERHHCRPDQLPSATRKHAGLIFVWSPGFTSMGMRGYIQEQKDRLHIHPGGPILVRCIGGAFDGKRDGMRLEDERVLAASIPRGLTRMCYRLHYTGTLPNLGPYAGSSFRMRRPQTIRRIPSPIGLLHEVHACCKLPRFGSCATSGVESHLQPLVESIEPRQILGPSAYCITGVAYKVPVPGFISQNRLSASRSMPS